MPVLYCDKKIKDFEKRLNLSQIIDYLEALFIKKEDEHKLASLIVYSWYFFIEGGFLLSDNNFDDEFYLSKWSFYLDYGEKNYSNVPEILFVSGYTLGLHWFFLDSKYNKKTGIEFMKRCCEISSDLSMKKLSNYFIHNDLKSKKNIVLEQASEICNEMFPSDSMTDRYFRSVLI